MNHESSVKKQMHVSLNLSVNKLKDVVKWHPNIPPQKMMPSGTPTSTSLPWKQLREWGRSMFRAERTGWLSWRAGGEGHRTDSATPNSRSTSEWFSTTAPSEYLSKLEGLLPVGRTDRCCTYTHPQVHQRSHFHKQFIPLKVRKCVGGLSAVVIL